MATTKRFSIPLLAAGQAQKEVTHNEALLLLDGLVQGICHGGPSDTPPGNPVEGRCYLCGANPTGDWAGHGGKVALWTAAGWRFLVATEGMQMIDSATGCARVFLNGQWSVGTVRATEVRVAGIKVLGEQRPAIAAPTGGTNVDGESRAALSAILATLRAHGLIAS